MLKKVLNYHEHRSYGEQDKVWPSITTLPRKRLPDEIREKVLDYMLNFDFVHLEMWDGLDEIDPFNGRSLGLWLQFLEDDEWSWNSVLPVLIRDHDIEIPQEFVDHVLEWWDNGGTIKKSFFHWRDDDKNK